MQTINDNTKQLRQNMAKAGIPSFSIGTSVGFSGDINFNASYRDQEVFNTANVDKSNADIKVEKEIAEANGGVFFSNETSGYKYIWHNANAYSKEYAAYITTRGVLVTPAQLNTSGTAEFLKYYNPTWTKGALFVSFKGSSYQVLGEFIPIGEIMVIMDIAFLLMMIVQQLHLKDYYFFQ